MTPDEIEKMIPDEAWKAAMRRFQDCIRAKPGEFPWIWREALAAGLAAWPEAHRLSIPVSLESDEASDDLILPLKKGDL